MREEWPVINFKPFQDTPQALPRVILEGNHNSLVLTFQWASDHYHPAYYWHDHYSGNLPLTLYDRDFLLRQYILQKIGYTSWNTNTWDDIQFIEQYALAKMIGKDYFHE